MFNWSPYSNWFATNYFAADQIRTFLNSEEINKCSTTRNISNSLQKYSPPLAIYFNLTINPRTATNLNTVTP